MSSSLSLPPHTALQGTVSPPGDKSITHRLVMLCAIAEGKSKISKFLQSDDCRRTIEAMKQLGVRIDESGKYDLTVHGVGLQGLKAPSKELDMGNSGTTTRLLAGILSAQPFDSILIGDESLSSRPMKRVVEPLRLMGAVIDGRSGGNYAPLRIHGGKLKAIRFENHLASAQVKSALLLAGLYAPGTTEIVEPRVSRDHTERILKAMGANIIVQGTKIQLQKTDKLKPIECTVPGDLSSASFWMAAGAIQPGKTIHVENVGLNPTRSGFVKALKKMGATIEVKVESEAVEPVGRISVVGSSLKAISTTEIDIPSLIDELPLIMVLGALAKGKTIIRGASELRLKESDRIHAMVKNLDILGVPVVEYPDGVEIKGQERFSGGIVESFGDHRIAMAMAIASLRATETVEIRDSGCVDISYPDFFKEFDRIRV